MVIFILIQMNLKLKNYRKTKMVDFVFSFIFQILDVLESEPEYEEAHLGYLLEEVQVTLSSGDEAL